MKHTSVALLLTTLLLLGAACQKKVTPSRTQNTPSTNTSGMNGSSLPPCLTPIRQNCDPNKTSGIDPSLAGGETAGKSLTNNRCSGSDKPKLTRLPMDSQDYALILPYGLMVGGHVTPIDHQYFSPTVFDSPPDTYPVYAMADSYLVDIGTRQHPGQGRNKNLTITDYRLVFSVSCRLLYYYDLVTSLVPGLREQFDAAGGNLKVLAGQVIGQIGGQTLDFAVWDMDKQLTGLLTPKLYLGERWKLYTVDPLDYYTDEIRTTALKKYLRTAEPRSGQIDYDVDGRLIGNWFQVGTNGYAGPGGGVEGYWNGHLAVAPDYLDPTKFVVSIGNWPSGASQFGVIGNAPNPATVGVASGLVKFRLGLVNYKVGNAFWDRKSIQTPITMVPDANEQGCFLAQLTGPRSLKAEAFKGKSCANVSGFTSAAVIYER